MKKNSHGNFGKQLTCAFAALALAALTTMSDVRGQDQKPQKSSAPSPQEIKTSHDTPPPVILMDGSFIVEIEKTDFDESEETANRPKKYRVKPRDDRKKLYLAHIRVVDGSGELLYRGDYHDHRVNLNVVVTTPAGDLVKFASVANKFEIETNGKRLEKTSDQPVLNKRMGRYRLGALGGTERLRRITVKKAAVPVFEVDLTELPPMGTDGGKETKVLIWLAEVTP